VTRGVTIQIWYLENTPNEVLHWQFRALAELHKEREQHSCYDRLFACDCLNDCFLILKPLQHIALSLPYLSYLVVNYQTLWKHDQKIQMQEGQVMSSSLTTEVFINNEKIYRRSLGLHRVSLTLKTWSIYLLDYLTAVENPWAYHSFINISSLVI
jgi:hypothetical protein